MKHGTINGYQHHKCRCTDCRDAKREYKKKLKLKKLEGIPELVERRREHGTAEAYSFGCTCDLCLTKGRNEYLAGIAA